MSRVYQTYKIEDHDLTKQQVLSWANQFNTCCFLDNQQYLEKNTSFDCIVAAGTKAIFNSHNNLFSSLSDFLSTNNDWIFGHFNFEAAMDSSRHLNVHEEGNFAPYYLFVPQVIIILKDTSLTIGAIENNAASIFSELQQQSQPGDTPHVVEFKSGISKATYLHCVEQLKKHIMRGDCYEINFCQEFYAIADINPPAVYSRLAKTSPNPFGAFYRINNNYLLCASPERYLKKTANRIISQPIKGTSPRDQSSQINDALRKRELSESEKDRSENVMIVDLVRNDLSKICEQGTVSVDELFGVYSFPQVHQMISTISGTLKKDVDFAEVLEATFPMGSMTGAPKRKVLELIEKFEEGKRGIYSGTVGYFTPQKDFDFNVVIRSLVYNAATNYLSFHTGSAITASSDAEKEYEECLLKGAAIREVFSENKKA